MVEKFVGLSLKIPKTLDEKIREACKENGMTKSELVRLAIRKLLEDYLQK